MMSFSYQVILRPTDVKFTEEKIANKFDNGVKLRDLKNDIFTGKVLTKDIPTIQVVWFSHKWEWYTLNNRRLWVFQELERSGKLTYVAMSRVELLNTDYVFPSLLYKDVKHFEPDWDIRATNNNLTVHSTSNSSLMNVAHLARSETSKRSNEAELNKKLNALLIANEQGDQSSNGDTVTADLPISSSVAVDLTIGQGDVVDLVEDGEISEELFEVIDEIKETVADKVEDKEELVVDSSNIDIKTDDNPSTPMNENLFIEVLNESKSNKLRSIVVKSSPWDVESLSSSMSTQSVSSISKKQRIISTTSGLSGYGYYHAYKTEYLDKLKKARAKALKRLKPYDVEKKHNSLSLMSSRCTSLSTFSGDLSVSDRPPSRPRSPTPERQLKRRKSDRLNDGASEDHQGSRIRLYSDDLGYSSNENGDYDRSWRRHDRQRKGRERSLEARPRRLSTSSDKRLLPYETVERRRSFGSFTSLESYDYSESVNNGVSFALLYATWQKKRFEFLQQSKYAITDASLPPYICGICFKRFTHIVDIQQHCEALMHYACISCGKFFSTYASLGQHCRQFRHKKD